ncbi:MAG: sn-glycerol-3-phosphate ABC transporter ATP-binding protein UgpC [Deltaproteobacteria bacterium]|nr:MAG: sn-glycerol-3-phosphate ABC transporter ATP-binding protein UgpC [Deltaproteobacteria bacterium]
MANVLLKNLTKKFDEVVAVYNVNLEIADREFVVLVGPSGCGKTTTLRMIAGLEEITEGEIYINDQLVNKLAPKDRNIAMVFQSYALYPHMKVFDNMAFGLKMRKVPKEEMEEKVKKAAEILGIEDLLSRKPRQLSGGQRQRVALGRAIVRDPEVFLFDEPLSNLDAKLRVQMRTELKKLHERLQATVVYVTHDQVEAMTMGDRIVVMKEGVVQQVGNPLELYNNPANLFVAGFIGSPAMNFIPCQLLEENAYLCIDTGDFRIPLPESIASKLKSTGENDFIFGIRPEDMFEKGPGQEPSTERPVIKAKVNVVEPLGKEISLDVSTGANSLTALLGADTDAKPHQDIDLTLNLDKAHLFRRQGGEAIV